MTRTVSLTGIINVLVGTGCIKKERNVARATEACALSIKLRLGMGCHVPRFRDRIRTPDQTKCRRKNEVRLRNSSGFL